MSVAPILEEFSDKMIEDSKVCLDYLIEQPSLENQN